MNEKDFIIITGASKGLGRELALSLSNPDTLLLLIARDKELLTTLQLECKLKGADTLIFATDLADINYKKDFSEMLFRSAPKKINKFYLFNNASIIEPITELVNTNFMSQKQVMNVNLISPLWITSECLRFIRETKPLKSYFINISSGVSLKPVYGWSLYCISKAAINMLTACVAEETKQFSSQVFSVSINPGALDTDMQKSIRKSDEKRFPIAKHFKEVYSNNKLKNTDDVAKNIVELLKKKPFPNGQFVDFNKR